MNKLDSSKMIQFVKNLLKVDRYMLASKLAYAFFGLRSVISMGFMLVLLKSVGLSATQSGIVYSMANIGIVFGNVYWTQLADRLNAHRLIWWMVCTLSTILMSAVPVVTRLLGDPKHNVCRMTDVSGEAIFSTTTLTAIVGTLLFFAFFCDFAASPLINGAVTRKIKLAERPINYGRQRLCFSLGYGVGNLCAGALVDAMPSMNITCYTGLFLFYIAASIPCAFAGDFIHKSLPILKDPPKPANLPEIIDGNKDGVVSLTGKISTFEIGMMLFCSTAIGVLYGNNIGFTMLYVCEELQVTNTIIGLFQLFAALSAITTYFFSSQIIDILRGEWNTVCLCLFVWLLRYTVSTLAKTVWPLLAMQLLHGLSFSLYIAALGHFVNKNISECAFARFYGINEALYDGIGMIVANLAGGFVYENYGPKYLFAGMTVVAGQSLVVLLLVRYWKRFN